MQAKGEMPMYPASVGGEKADGVHDMFFSGVEAAQMQIRGGKSPPDTCKAIFFAQGVHHRIQLFLRSPLI